MRNSVIERHVWNAAFVCCALALFLYFGRVYVNAERILSDKEKDALKETWIGDSPPIVSNAGNSGVKTTAIDTPDTLIGALKAVHELQINISGHVYTAKTPFWVTGDNVNQHVVFDARRKEDERLVRVYAFSSPALVIEEDITKKE